MDEMNIVRISIVRGLLSFFFVCIFTSLVTSCGGGGGSSTSNDVTPQNDTSIVVTDPPAKPVLKLDYGLKQFYFNWNAVEGAATYRFILRDRQGFYMAGHSISGLTSLNYSYPVMTNTYGLNWDAFSFVLGACNLNGCTESDPVQPSDNLIHTTGYFKASNTDTNDWYGHSVDINQTGNVMVVGAPRESSQADNVNGDESNNLLSESGAAYVYKKINKNWVKDAYLKPLNPDENDMFGVAVSISTDGNTIAVGARGEDSNTDLIQGDDQDNSTESAGAAYIFKYVNNTWIQTAYIKASNSDAGDSFGWSLSLSGDGNRLAVGAQYEESSATGINQDQGNEPGSLNSYGAVYVYQFLNNSWTQQAYIKASNTGYGDSFGQTVALSRDGNTLAVGAPFEDGDADSVNNSGAVYLYRYQNTSWNQQNYFRSGYEGANDYFGFSIALTEDGNIMAVGSYAEDGNGKISTITNNPIDPSLSYNSGAISVYRYESSSWNSIRYFKSSYPGEGDEFGRSVDFDDDGSVLVVGAPGESSNAVGIEGDQENDLISKSGAVYVFQSLANTPYIYVKAPNTDNDDGFGRVVAVSGDGYSFAVGVLNEDSNAINLNQDQTNNDKDASGAVYLY